MLSRKFTSRMFCHEREIDAQFNRYRQPGYIRLIFLVSMAPVSG